MHRLRRVAIGIRSHDCLAHCDRALRICSHDCLAHCDRALGSVRESSEILKHVGHLAEGESRFYSVQSVVLEPHWQRSVWWKLLRCDRTLSMLGTVIEQVEPLHDRAVAWLEKDLLTSGQQAPRLVCLRQERLPVADGDDV